MASRQSYFYDALYWENVFILKQRPLVWTSRLFVFTDIRKQEVVKGRSINLALSRRGREALKGIGMEEEVIRRGVPMYARMIHDRDGTLRPIPYGKGGQVWLHCTLKIRVELTLLVTPLGTILLTIEVSICCLEF